MTTREKAHKLLDELPDSEIEPVLDFIASRGGTVAAEPRADDAILEGYKRLPQTAEEQAWALANAREAIREEPW